MSKDATILAGNQNYHEQNPPLAIDYQEHLRRSLLHLLVMSSCLPNPEYPPKGSTLCKSPLLKETP